MSARVLLVDGHEPSLKAETDWLRSADYETAAFSSFEEARGALDRTAYDVLIADIRLGAFNGIHLGLLARHRNPQVHVVVTNSSPTFRNDALRAGAEKFLVKPFDRDGFLQIVDDLMHAGAAAPGPERRWPRVPLPRSREARMEQAEARVLEVSYGGVRIEVPGSPTSDLGSRVQLQILDPTLLVYIRPVWLQPSSAGRYACGAEVVDQDPSSADRWRSFVDAMTAA